MFRFLSLTTAVETCLSTEVLPAILPSRHTRIAHDDQCRPLFADIYRYIRFEFVSYTIVGSTGLR